MCYILQKFGNVYSYNLEVMFVIVQKKLKMWINIICRQNLPWVMLSKIKRRLWFGFSKFGLKIEKKKGSWLMEPGPKTGKENPFNIKFGFCKLWPNVEKKENYFHVRDSHTRTKNRVILGLGSSNPDLKLSSIYVLVYVWVCQTRTKIVLLLRPLASRRRGEIAQCLHGLSEVRFL